MHFWHKCWKHQNYPAFSVKNIAHKPVKFFSITHYLICTTCVSTAVEIVNLWCVFALLLQPFLCPNKPRKQRHWSCERTHKRFYRPASWERLHLGNSGVWVGSQWTERPNGVNLAAIQAFLASKSPLVIQKQLLNQLHLRCQAPLRWTVLSQTGKQMQACMLVLVCANINQSVFSFLRQLTTWYCSHSPAADTVWPLLTAN